MTAAPIYYIDQFVADPHVQARQIVVDVPDEEIGSVTIHNVIPRLSATPGVLRRPAPKPGEHTADVLARVATHKSIKPFPPSRSDVMKISRPSLRSHTRVSRFGLLSSATRTPGPNDAFARSLSVVEVR